jgi:hypothetical protein
MYLKFTAKFKHHSGTSWQSLARPGIEAVEPFGLPVFTGMTARHPATVQIILVPVR